MSAALPVRHGTRHSPTYKSWSHMKYRCTNPRSSKFPDYGGRGISVCKEWLDFSGFLRDMGPRPSGTTLDRIDNDGNYEPGNCRWATTREQQRNKRNSKLVTAFGKTQPVPAWADELGVKAWLIYCRLSRGHRGEEALRPAGKPCLHFRRSYGTAGAA